MIGSDGYDGDASHRSALYREAVRFTLTVVIAGVVYGALADLIARPVLLVVPSNDVALVLLGAESALTGALFVMCLWCIANAGRILNAVGPLGALVVLGTCVVLIIHILFTSVVLQFVVTGSVELGFGPIQVIFRADLVLVMYVFIVRTWDGDALHRVVSDGVSKMFALIVVVVGVAYAALMDIVARPVFLVVPSEGLALILMGAEYVVPGALFVMCLEYIANARWVRRAVGTREFVRFTLMLVVAGVAYAVLTDLIARPVLLSVPSSGATLILQGADSVITGALLVMCLECIANARWVHNAVGILGALVVLGTCFLLIIHILLTNVVLQFMLTGSVELALGLYHVVVRAALAVVVYLFLARTWESPPVQNVNASGGPEYR